MKIAIIGTGGVGGYFGGKLAQAGNKVTFVARGEHYNAIKNKGLKIKSINGDFKIENVNIVNDILLLDKPDLILIAVKAWQVKDTALKLKQILHNNSIVIPLQNGVLAADELLKIIDKNHVVGGFCKIFSKIDSPGIIHHMGVEPTIVFGELNNQKTERVLKIKELFDYSNITSVLHDDIQSALWQKFLAICISGLIGITRSSYGAVREIPETRKLMTELFTEIYNVAIAIGINLPSNIVEKTIGIIDTYPYETTSSLARDVMEGKPSEIEYQNGTVVKLGIEYNVPTPVNSFIYSTILPMQLKTRKNYPQK